MLPEVISAIPIDRKKLIIFVTIVLLILILYVTNAVFGWFDALINRMTTKPTAANNDAMRSRIIGELAATVDKLENMRKDYTADVSYAQVPADEHALVNFHVLGCRLTGYLADKQEYGIFSEADATRMALKIGMRVLVLDIDYLTDDPTVPVLVCRNGSGRLVSNNTGKIAAVTGEIARFLASPSSTRDPIIVVLNVRRLPDGGRDSRDAGSATVSNLKFMEAIAAGLKPLSKLIMRQTEAGVFLNQGMESELFLQPISTYEKRVIVLANVNTAGFRTPPKEYTVTPSTNLDMYVHGRIYNNETPVEPPTIPAIYANPAAFYMQLPTDDATQRKYTGLITKCWSAALPMEQVPRMLPSVETMAGLMRLGVQAVIVDMVDVLRHVDDHEIYKRHFRTTSYVLKPESLRYKKLAATEAGAPAATMNAGGGVVKVL